MFPISSAISELRSVSPSRFLSGTGNLCGHTLHSTQVHRKIQGVLTLNTKKLYIQRQFKQFSTICVWSVRRMAFFFSINWSQFWVSRSWPQYLMQRKLNYCRDPNRSVFHRMQTGLASSPNLNLSLSVKCCFSHILIPRFFAPHSLAACKGKSCFSAQATVADFIPGLSTWTNFTWERVNIH